jgi:hypothetical protein
VGENLSRVVIMEILEEPFPQYSKSRIGRKVDPDGGILKNPQLDRAPPRVQPPPFEPPVGKPEVRVNPPSPHPGPPGPEGPKPMAPQNPSTWWRIKVVVAEVVKGIGNAFGMGSRFTAPIIMTPTSVIQRQLDMYKPKGTFQDAKVDTRQIPKPGGRFYKSTISQFLDEAYEESTKTHSENLTNIKTYTPQRGDEQ